MGDFEIGEVKVYITDDTGKTIELQDMTIDEIKFVPEKPSKQNKHLLNLLSTWQAEFTATIKLPKCLQRLLSGIRMTIPENMKHEFTKPTRRGVHKVYRH